MDTFSLFIGFSGSEDDVRGSLLEWFFPKLMIWLLNALVMACVMAKIFVFGEPVTKPLTKLSVAYWRSRRQADAYLARVNTNVLRRIAFFV